MSNTTYPEALALLNAHPARGTPDIAACFNPRSNHFFSEKTHNAGVALGFEWATIFKLPQKQIKRATQFINAINEGISTGFDKTHARLLIAMREAGQYKLTTDALHALAANARKGDVNTRGVGLGRINAKFKEHHSVSTVPTKTSNSIGKNGFMTVCGMVTSDHKQNNEVLLNADSAAVKRFFAVIDGMTENQLSDLLS